MTSLLKLAATALVLAGLAAGTTACQTKPNPDPETQRDAVPPPDPA